MKKGGGGEEMTQRELGEKCEAKEGKLSEGLGKDLLRHAILSSLF